MQRTVLSLGLALLVAACGPGISYDDDGGSPLTADARPDGHPDGGSVTYPDAYSGEYGRLTGHVWAPGNAPGLVPTGHEIPIFKALVWMSFNKPAAIQQTVFCDQCVTPPSGALETDVDGLFDFAAVMPGTYWLVIQKGQFRIEQQVVIAPNDNIELPATATTLPNATDQANGRWVPRMALAEGLWDNMEDILGKMSLGEVDSENAYLPASAVGHYDLYENGSGDYGAEAMGTLQELASNIELMRQYHIIFVPCSDGATDLLFSTSDATIRNNIRQYVNEGGKFYVTDWSAEWEDAVFPDFIKFSTADTAGATPTTFGSGNGSPGYESEFASAADEGLNAWLMGQQGPLVGGTGGYANGTINADSFVVEGNWDHIDSLGSITIGQNEEQMPIVETPKSWVIGDWGDGGVTTHPLTVTFEPTGCGRVLYSTYHTADNAHVGLVPQERVLLYLIMEIGVCKSGPIVD